MVFERDITSVSNLAKIAEEFLLQFSDYRIFVFDAQMGAGKTTFIKELCKALGSSDAFSSPTYPIVNEYVFPSGKIFHFDLYRLKSEAELMDLGFEDYVTQDAYLFIEWPELALPFLIEDKAVRVKITMQETQRLLVADLTQS